MTTLENMPPYKLCYELDRICAPFYFTFSGSITENKLNSIHVYHSNNHTNEIAVFVVDENNPREYVLTRILLQFSGGE